jgi:dihydrofolate reductase
LPGRQNIVISRNPGFRPHGADIAHSLEEAISVSRSDEIMVIGGGQLYALAMPLATGMVLTLIDLEPRADTWFPEWDERDWRQVSERHFPVADDNPLAYRIVELVRAGKPSG